MKCRICGSEIGNKRFCNMCGAENQPEILRENEKEEPAHIDAPLSEGGLSDDKEMDGEKETAADYAGGTTVLTDDGSFGIYSGTIYGKQNTDEKVIHEFKKKKTKKELKREAKEKKKREQGYVNKVPFMVTIIILGVAVLGLTAALIYSIFFKSKIYIEVLEDIDSTALIYDESSDTILAADGSGNTLTDISQAEYVAADKSAVVAYDDDGSLVYRCLTGTDKSLGTADKCYANANLTTIITVSDVDGEVEFGFYNDGKEVNNVESFSNVRDLKVSDTGGYFAFCTDYSETHWEEDPDLPDGGQSVTVYLNDLYIVNYNGETKKVLTSETKVVPNYITSAGQLFYTEQDEDETLYIYQNGESDKLLYKFSEIVFYENLNSYLILTSEGELWYGSFSDNSQSPYMTATGVQGLFIVGGNKEYKDYRDIKRSYQVTESCSCYDTDMIILYYKNDTVFLSEPALMSDSIKLKADCEEAADFTVYKDMAYYLSGGVIYRLKKDTLLSSEENKRTGEVIETYNWSDGVEIASVGGGSFDVLNDGTVIYLINDSLYYNDGSGEKLYDTGISMYAVNDSSHGFMFIKDGTKLCYSMGPKYESQDELCDVSNVTSLAATNETAYYTESDSGIKSVSVDDKTVTEINSSGTAQLMLLRNKEYAVAEDGEV